MKIKFEKRENLKDKPKDIKDVVFGTVFTDYMLKISYKKDIGWHNMLITPYKPIEIEPASIILNYSQSVFEGLKAYLSEEDEILLFRPDKNMKRLNQSCDRLCIPKIDEKKVLEGIQELLKIEKDWIPKGENSSLYIRPIIYGTSSKLGVIPSEEYELLVILSPVGPYYKSGMKPVNVLVEDEYVRATKGGMGFAKTGGNYAVGLKSQEKAYKKGYNQIMWLDGVHRKYVEELGGMNVFFVIDKKVITPSVNGSILEGVTRESVIEILKENKYQVEERNISINEIYDAYENGSLQEIFSTGTAAVISPVGKLMYKDKEISINNQEIGKVSLELYKEITDIQYGRKESKWSVIVK